MRLRGTEFSAIPNPPGTPGRTLRRPPARPRARGRHGATRGPAVALLVALLLAIASPARAGWRTFTATDGMPNNIVRSLLEDDAETMWFATLGGGVAHYDGVTWRVFTTADGLASNEVTCVFQDRDGNLWFGTWDGGVTRYDGTSMRTFSTATGDLAHNNVFSISQDAQGRIWVATQGGGANWMEPSGAWYWYTTSNSPLPSNTVLAIHEDRNENLWFGTINGLVRRTAAGVWKAFGPDNSGLPTNWVRAIFEDSRRQLWFCTSGGLARLDSLGGWATFTEADGLAGKNVYGVLEDRQGDMWFGSLQKGITRYDGRSWRRYSSVDGYFTNSNVYEIEQDRSGNLWFATVGGAVRFDGVSMETFREVTELSTIRTVGITEDPDGSLWIGTEGAGAFHFDGAGWTQYSVATTDSQLPSDLIDFVARDTGGSIWFASYGQGIARWDGQATWSHFTKQQNGLATDRVLEFVEDQQHHMWFAGRGGVSRFDGTTWMAYTNNSTGGGLASDSLYGVFLDRDGDFWFCSQDRGAIRFDGVDSWETWDPTTTHGGVAGNWVLTVRQTRNGDLWFATPGHGISRLDRDSVWTHFTSEDGLPNDWVLSTMEDREGKLWFALDNGGGVARWDGESWRTLGLDDGLPSNSVHLMHEDPHGYLWFTTNRGVARYERDRVPPRTVLITRPPRISASRSQSAVFGALGERDRLEYAFRLDGGFWSDWSDLNAWSAQDLGDGTHTLEVRARDYWGNADATPEVATFEIDATPPVPLIAAPGFGTPVRGSVAVLGEATDARFANYEIRVRPGSATSWDPPQAVLLVASTQPVSSGVLATWDTTPFTDGVYEMQLSVTDSLGLTGTVRASVVVDNVAPYADVTAPAKVTAATGGDIYTTGSELHLYFPPHAFDADAVVTIVANDAAAVPDPLPSGAVRVLPGYDIGWSGAVLRKPARLEFSLAGANSDGLALHRSGDGVNWQRVGGTVEGGGERITLAATEPGRYALFAGGTVPDGSGLSALTFTPRVFSPTGGFANRELGIGFSLGRPGTATVRVYNRAGRLVREVVSDQSFGAGANLVRWDGRDREGVVVHDGLYIVTVEALGETKRSPLAVVR